MAFDFAAQILEGSPRAAARLISWLEDEDDRAYEWMAKLYPHTGRAYIIGITGSPGAGKSTLTDKLARVIRKSGLKIGIIAVDPSSPFTGGALLGDRVRMSELTNDPDIYIRSMATRGFLGGMAKATGDVVKVLDAFGKDVILIETVGVGQDEIDIIGIADTTCLVLVPGLGDAIQSMKAGIMEIADVFVVNKADKLGAEQLCTEVCSRLEIDAHIKERDWTVPVNKSRCGRRYRDRGTVALHRVAPQISARFRQVLRKEARKDLPGNTADDPCRAFSGHSRAIGAERKARHRCRGIDEEEARPLHSDA